MRRQTSRHNPRRARTDLEGGPFGPPSGASRVGTAGFEPATSASRTLRATKLRYVPRPASVASGHGPSPGPAAPRRPSPAPVRARGSWPPAGTRTGTARTCWSRGPARCAGPSRPSGSGRSTSRRGIEQFVTSAPDHGHSHLPAVRVAGHHQSVPERGGLGRRVGRVHDRDPEPVRRRAWRDAESRAIGCARRPGRAARPGDRRASTLAPDVREVGPSVARRAGPPGPARVRGAPCRCLRCRRKYAR